ncbi:MAG: hypothetical protein E7551_07510 [Ruminococcaceae bacterium]|nr:hypothetical protein [Oscillospiraceae bacterium]
MRSKIKKIATLCILVMYLFTIVFGNGVLTTVAETEKATVHDIKVNSLFAPIGIDTPNPVFSWKMNSDNIGAKQTAYSVVVTDENGAEMWNTGWVESNLSVNIPYNGTPLVSSTRYNVSVGIKDENGVETPRTESYFETALLEENAFDDTSWISYQQTGEESTDATAITSFTVDFDFKINSANQGFAIGMSDDLKTYLLFQISTQNSSDKSIILRAHAKVNGSWTVLPGAANKLVLNDAIGYDDTTVFGHIIHERIEVNGKEAKLYFGPDENNLTYAGTYTHNKDITLGKIGFRHNLKGPLESTSYDNIVVKNQTGYIIYSEDFSSGVSNFEGTINESVVDGMLLVGSDNETYTEGVIVLKSFGTYNSSATTNIPVFRKKISVASNLTSAKLYTSGLGIYESYINGERVGNLLDDGSISYDELKPGYTGTSRRQYNTYDVTHMLNSGADNVLSSIVTEGWWSAEDSLIKQGEESAYFAKMILTYANGDKEIINTNTDWKTAAVAPVQADTSIYNGEHYDATADTAWMYPNYNDSAWSTPKVNTEFSGELVAQAGAFVKVRKDLERTPQKISVYEGAEDSFTGYYGRVKTIATYEDGADIVLNPGQTLLVDFGQNFAGFESFEVTSKRGTVISVTHGEMLNDGNGAFERGNDGPEGSIHKANYRTSKSNTTYVTAGYINEVYNPAFSFYGFRYVEFTVSKTTTFHLVRGNVLTSVLEDTAEMITSDDDVNQLISNIKWSMYSNYLSVATDCPQRDERLGWLGDTQVFAKTGLFLGDNKAFLRKYMLDIRDGQVTDTSSEYYGAYPAIAPGSDNLGTYGAFGWADCGIILPYYLYMMSGDTSVINEMWSSMRLYMDEYLAKRTYGGTASFGDWLSYETTTSLGNQMLGTCFHALDACMMSEMANALGDSDAADHYKEVYDAQKTLYNNTFVNSDGTLKEVTQAVCLYALYTDMVDNEEPVINQLITNIERNGNKLQTGFLGTAILMSTLTKIGRTDIAYKLLLQHDNPSWLYSVDQGATTIWERWNSYTVSNGFGAVSMNSFNHYAYGAVLGWMYSDMAGIDYDTKSPGFKNIILSPKFDSALPTVNAKFDSPYGEIVSNMHYESGKWNYSATVPANATATIILPMENIETLKVNGKGISEVTTETDGINFVGFEDGKATFNAVSGSFEFETEYTKKHTLNITVEGKTDEMPAIEAEVRVNGVVKSNSIPATLDVLEGDVVTATATCLNSVDYVVKGWSASGKIISTNNALEYTVTDDDNIVLSFADAEYMSIAEGKTVTANSANSDWAAAHLTDGIKSYLGGTKGWSSHSVGSNISSFKEVTAVIDLGKNYSFNRFHIYPRNDILSSGVLGCPTSFTIYVSDDNVNWQPVYSVTDAQVTNGYTPMVVELDKAVNGKYVKLGVTAISKADQYGTGYVQLSEFGVYCTEHTYQNDICTNCGGANNSSDSVRYKISSSVYGKFDYETKVAAIRTADSASELKQGIRIKTAIDTSILVKNYAEGYTATEYGTIAAKTVALNGEELLYTKIGGDQIVRRGIAYKYYPATDRIEKNVIFEQNGSRLVYTALLTGIEVENYAVDYCVRSYIKFSKSGEKDIVIYGDVYDITVKSVAETILSTPETDDTSRKAAVSVLKEYDAFLGKNQLFDLENWNYASWVKANGDGESYVNFTSAKWQEIRLTLKLKKNTKYKFTTNFYQSSAEELTDTMSSMEVYKNVDGILTNIYRTASDKYYWTSTAATNSLNPSSISATFTTTDETETYVLEFNLQNVANVTLLNMDIIQVE